MNFRWHHVFVFFFCKEKQQNQCIMLLVQDKIKKTYSISNVLFRGESHDNVFYKKKRSRQNSSPRNKIISSWLNLSQNMKSKSKTENDGLPSSCPFVYLPSCTDTHSWWRWSKLVDWVIYIKRPTIQGFFFVSTKIFGLASMWLPFLPLQSLKTEFVTCFKTTFKSSTIHKIIFLVFF